VRKIDVKKKPVSPFARDLTGSSLAEKGRHAEATERLFRSVVEIAELGDGYSFRLPSQPDALLAAAEFIARESRYCPFFGFALELEPEGGPLWLRITGKDGSKRLLEADLRMRFARTSDGGWSPL
jgi:hypothetical protein